jgi:cell wall-associated NlpC family hydrolase
MPGNPPVPTGTTRTRTVKDQTSALTPTPSPSPNRSSDGFKYVKGEGVSFELQDAPFVCTITSLPEISLDEMRVLAWLRDQKFQIIAAEAQFQVDRRAIAGAIAWEALKNVHSWSARAGGPGKLHEWRWNPHIAATLMGSLLSTTDEGTWVKAVEDEKLLPKQRYSDRKKLLQSASGAIQYVAATMDLIALLYERAGSPGTCLPSIRINAPILLNEYQGSDPGKWAARVKTIKKGEILKPGNPMAIWYLSPHNQQLLQDAVGPSEVRDEPTRESGTCETDYRDVAQTEATTILQKAKAYKGTPYKWGGNNKDGIDCSHLVWRAINDALPTAKFEYIDTAGMPDSPSLRKLDANESRISGDVVLMAHHVGFYDAAPPADQVGRSLFSAEGSQTSATPGVTWGKLEWFTGPFTYYRVRVPCK